MINNNNNNNFEQEKDDIESSIIDDDNMDIGDNKSRFNIVKIAGSIKSEGKIFLYLKK